VSNQGYSSQKKKVEENVINEEVEMENNSTSMVILETGDQNEQLLCNQQEFHCESRTYLRARPDEAARAKLSLDLADSTIVTEQSERPADEVIVSISSLSLHAQPKTLTEKIIQQPKATRQRNENKFDYKPLKHQPQLSHRSG